ncbi:MAG: hypothetical protein LBU34_05650 [Planctomycetaceae bacterium]|jgi:hypothetical protein|nr:hypothetical protein [Planctomycetaceae bacterium]
MSKILKCLLCLVVISLSLEIIVVASEPSHVTAGMPVFTAIPESWLTEWNDPTVKNRPLQIIHGSFGDRTTPEKLRYYKDDCGLGGLVINLPFATNAIEVIGGLAINVAANVPSDNYLRNEIGWQHLVEVVRSAKEIGLRIWIYDEDGYPSLAAGGLVLEGHPELESQALVYDETKNDNTAFSVRAAYEYTHAASNYYVLRRYPNPLNPNATKRFIEVTHEQYKKRLGDLHNYIEAYFTDEPSLNAVNIGTVPDDVQKTRPIADPIDPNIPLLPMAAWSDELVTVSGDAPFNKKSLFVGDTDADKNERQRFWNTVTQLNSQFYYQAIRDWCRANHVASSGHTLREENTDAHVPLDGNKLTILRMMDIPGLDMLNSDPRVFAWSGWKAAGFPASAAALNETRLIFTEVSDFNGHNGDLASMQATAAWQAIWGVTEFALYYGITGTEIHKKYCDYIGRLNAVLREAKPIRSVLLYYPITDLQREYKPTAEPLNIKTQSQRMQEIIQSFDRIGEMLVRCQIPFIIVDDQGIKDWLRISQRTNLPLLVPQNVQIPQEIRNLGICELTDVTDNPLTPQNIENHLENILDSKLEKIVPANGWISFGHFERDNRTIYVVLNAGNEPYQGILKCSKIHARLQLDPMTGKIEEIQETDAIPLALAPLQTLIFVEK